MSYGLWVMGGAMRRLRVMSYELWGRGDSPRRSQPSGAVAARFESDEKSREAGDNQPGLPRWCGERNGSEARQRTRSGRKSEVTGIQSRNRGLDSRGRWRLYSRVYSRSMRSRSYSLSGMSWSSNGVLTSGGGSSSRAKSRGCMTAA